MQIVWRSQVISNIEDIVVFKTTYDWMVFQMLDAAQTGRISSKCNVDQKQTSEGMRPSGRATIDNSRANHGVEGVEGCRGCTITAGGGNHPLYNQQLIRCTLHYPASTPPADPRDAVMVFCHISPHQYHGRPDCGDVISRQMIVYRRTLRAGY